MNKQDFLQGITGKPVKFLIPDVGEVLVKSLSAYDLKILQAEEYDNFDATMKMIILGLVEPKLDTEDLDLLYQANPSVIRLLAEKIQQLSGIESEGKVPN